MSEQEYIYGVKELEAIITRIKSGNCTEAQKKEFHDLFWSGITAVEEGE